MSSHPSPRVAMAEVDVRKLRGLTAGIQRGAPHPTSPRPGTPSSSRSVASLIEFDETLSDAMEGRMQSLVDLRKKVEDLLVLQRREEDSFRLTMEGVLQQSSMVRATQREMEGEYGEALQRERAERQKILQMMSEFRKEGGEAMKNLKMALKDVQAKYKAEVERSNRLAAQLDRVSGGHGAGATENRSSLRSSSGGATAEQQVTVLSQLLEDSDAVIIELQERNRALEQKVNVLTQQRDRLLDVDTEETASEGFAADLQQLIMEVRRYDQPNTKGGASNGAPAAGPAAEARQQQVSALKKLTKMLMQKLQSEQRQRLRTEEQAARMAASQDQLLRKMEQRVKELESRGGQSSAPVRSAHWPPSVTDSPSITAAPVSKAESVPPALLSAPAPLIHEPVQQEVIGVEMEPSPAMDVSPPPRGANAPPQQMSDGVRVVSHELARPAQQYAAAPTPASNVAEEDDEQQYAPAPRELDALEAGLPSLEEQLAAVSADFQSSLQQWSTALASDLSYFEGGGNSNNKGDQLKK